MSSIYEIKYYNYQIYATVTNSPSIVDEWIENTLYFNRRNLNKLLVGLDTEWCLLSDTNQHQKIAIIQLCVGRRCLIFQLYHASHIPQSLIDFLGNEKFKFIGKEVKNDADKLYEDYGLQVGHVKDIAYWAASKYHDKDFRKYGLKALVREFLQKIIQKPYEITMSDWSVKELCYEQVEYACLDAFVSYKVGEFLSKPRPELKYLEEHSPKRIADPYLGNNFVRRGRPT